MGEAGAEMVAGAVQENLGLVFEPAKRAGMDDPRPVALELGAIIVARLGIFPAAGLAGFLGERSQELRLVALHIFARFPTFPRSRGRPRIIAHTGRLLAAAAGLRVRS